MQGDPLSMVLYGITLAPLTEGLHTAAPDLLTPFYVDYDTYDGPEERSARLMTVLLERGA